MNKNLNIIAFYVCYQGEDFLRASVDSIYNHVNKIIFFCSHVSWKGQSDSIGNTCLPIISEWKKINDYQDKIVIVSGKWDDQLNHYTYAYNFLKQHYTFDYAMCIDTDEIWDDNNIGLAIQQLKEDNFKHDSFSCKMFTYVKSPYFLVTPEEPCSPVVFMSNRIKEIKGVRCNRVENRTLLKNVKYHHMCYVRVKDASIKRKFKSIQIADGSPSHIDWLINIYNKLNIQTIKYMRNLHPTRGAESCWQSLTKINKSDLSPYLQKDIVLNNWNEYTGEKT